MGFRSVFMTEDNGLSWPSWFVVKYENVIQFNFSHKGIFCSSTEVKLYREDMVDLPQDIQKAIDWNFVPTTKQFLVIFLHECGGVSRLHITRDSIRWSEPTGWEETGEVTHHDCLGCDKI